MWSCDERMFWGANFNDFHAHFCYQMKSGEFYTSTQGTYVFTYIRPEVTRTFDDILCRTSVLEGATADRSFGWHCCYYIVPIPKSVDFARRVVRSR